MSELTNEQYTMLQDRLSVPGIPAEQRKRFAPLMEAYEAEQTAADTRVGRDPEGVVLPAALPEVLATPPKDIPAVVDKPEPDAAPPFVPGAAASFLPEGTDAPYFYQEPPQEYGEGDKKFAQRAEEQWVQTEAAFREANAPILRVAKITSDEVGPLSFMRGKAAELYEPILGGLDETVSGGAIREALSGLIGDKAHSPEIQQALAQLQESGALGGPAERVQETMEASPGKTLLGNVAGFAVPGPGVGKAIVGTAAKGAQKIAGAIPFKGSLGKAGGDIAASIMKGIGATTAGAGAGAGLEAVDQAVKSAAGQESIDAERVAKAGIGGALIPGALAGSRVASTIAAKLPLGKQIAAMASSAWKKQKSKLSKPAETARKNLEEGYAKHDGLKMNKRKSRNTIPISEARKKYGDETVDKLLKANPKGKYISVTPRTAHDQRRLGRLIDDVLISKKDKVGSEKDMRTMLKNSPEMTKEMDTMMAAPGTMVQKIDQFIKNHKSKEPAAMAGASAMLSRYMMKMMDTHKKMKDEDDE